MNSLYTKIGIIIFALFASISAFATDVIKTNVGIGYLDVSGNTASFNLTLQELDAAESSYPYRQYSTECSSGIELSLTSGESNARLFSVLLTAKQGQNYVDVKYEDCVLKAITIKYKQN